MIAVSAGHYPAKPGACDNGFCEHDEAMKWMRLIVSHLDGIAFEVPTGFLRDKIKFINDRTPELAVEVHFNDLQKWIDANNNGIIDEGEMKHVGSGAMTLYYPGSMKGKRFAEAMQLCYEPIFGKSWRGVMEGWYRMDPKRGPDFFLKRTACPAVILEPEFISNKNGIVTNREKICESIAATLVEVRDEFYG